MLRKLYLGIFIALLLQATVFAEVKPDAPMDIFSYRHTRIEANQTVERLIVSSANATILGVVKDGVLVIDGDLILEAGAWVEGRIIVLGGKADIRLGSYAENTPWIIAPTGTPFTKTLLTSLLLLSVFLLITVPYVLWVLQHLLRNVPWFLRLKKGLLKIQHRQPALYIAITLTFSGLMLLFFSELAWKTMFRQTMGIFDNTFIWVVRYFAAPSLDTAMIFITDLGYGPIYMTVVAFSGLLLAVSRRWLEFKAFLICLMGSAVLNSILKLVFQRTRPVELRIVEAVGYSFPSGHAMMSLCLYGMLAFLIARNIRSRHGRIAVTVVAILLICAIGISRIYLGVHFPSDVAAGYTAGGTWLAFSISLLMWWEHKRAKDK